MATMTRAFSFHVLSDGSMVLIPDEACLQSTAKHAHRELTMALLEGRTAGPAREARVDLLERFPCMTDFATLRTEHPELAGQSGCRVRRFWRAADPVRWEVVSPR
jgi:hypothetical protein